MYTYGLFTIPLIFITLGPVGSTSFHVISWHWTEDDGVVQQCMYVSSGFNHLTNSMILIMVANKKMFFLFYCGLVMWYNDLHLDQQWLW